MTKCLIAIVLICAIISGEIQVLLMLIDKLNGYLFFVIFFGLISMFTTLISIIIVLGATND
jgi:hypothetical protein